MPPSGAEPDAVVWSGEVAPQIPFSFEQSDVVLDFKSLCGLPWDPQQDGIHTFRALIFDKGKVMHVPDMPGRYVVDGNWDQQSSLQVVHFVESTRRLPELLLSFIDHGMACESQTGISVETLKLPLLIRKDTYETSARVAPMSDVAGFTRIAVTQAPWSLHLAKCLAKLPMFKELKITSPGDVEVFYHTPLSERVAKLRQITLATINTELKAALRQDAGVASRRKAALVATLDSIVATIQERSDLYAQTFYDRIIDLSEPKPTDVDVAALRVALAATPRLLRSRLINPPLRSPVERTVRSSANIPASEGPAVVQEPAEAVPAGAGTAPTDVLLTELPAQAEASPNAHELVLESSGESDVDEKTDAKRPRNAPARLADEARPPKKRKVVAAAAAPAAEAKAKQAKPKPSKPKPRGGALNRDGQPYKRGPYNLGTKKGSLKDATELTARQTKHAAEQATVLAQVTGLQDQVKTLTVENADLKAKLAAHERTAALQLQIAVQKAQLSDAEKMFTKYSQGVQMGMGRAQGASASGSNEAPMFTPCPSAYGGGIPQMGALA